jgi:heme exporter protein D
MNWSSANEFFAMGGHGFYVWGSFLAVALCMIVEPFVLRARRHHARQMQRQAYPRATS